MRTVDTLPGGLSVAGWLLDDADGDVRIAIGPSTSYADLSRAVDEFASSLRERTGGEGAALVAAPRTQEGIVGLLGVLAAGLTAVVIAPDVDQCTLRHIVGQTEPIIDVGPIANLGPLRRHARRSGGGPIVSLGGDGVAGVIYTSGTTALPKGVQLTHRNIVANASAVSSFVGLRSDDVVSLVLPLHFSYGLSMLLISLRARARLVLHDDFMLPAQCVRTMCEEATTVFAGVPHHYQRLLAPSSGLREARCLRLLLSAGGAMTPGVLERLRGEVPNAQPLIMYGQTEATARLSYLPVAELERRPTSIGRGMPGVELTVRDASGRPVAPGEVGEVYARGENVMAGYIGDAAASAAVLTPWGLRTHDLATIDDDGYIYLRGRTADFAKIRGVRVSLPEVEALTEELDFVVEALASVELGPDGDEQIALLVRLDGECAIGDWPRLQRTIRVCLPASKRPARIESVEQIPRTASGKKLRRRP
jgi:long-chain acyl-CoA synthetase